MNNTIGFSNFRRFTNFPEIELGDITILVGGNNAGKSTLVKAMLLMRDFLKSRIEGVDNSKNDNQFGETIEPLDSPNIPIQSSQNLSQNHDEKVIRRKSNKSKEFSIDDESEDDIIPSFLRKRGSF